MKIAYVVNTYPRPSHSFIRREIRALERRGLTVHRFAMRGDAGVLVDPADLEEHARTEHVLDHGALALFGALIDCVFRAPARMLAALRLALACGRRGGARGGPGGMLRHLVYLAEAAWLCQRCRALEVTHLHAHFGTNSATVALLCHRLGGPRFSFTVHGPEEFDQPVALSLREKMQAAAFTVAVSRFGRSQLCRWADFCDWPRLHVVPCAIEPGRFARHVPPPAAARRELVAIGRLSEQKGQMLLIEALARLRDRLPSGVPMPHLTLVGDGPLRNHIASAVAAARLGQDVTLAGWQDEDGVRAALDAADALVLPSFAEGLPMVVMEAMAAARPVIATWIAGIPELVLPGKTGWLVPAGDAEAFAEAMTEMVATSAQRLAEMGTEGRARSLSRHDADAAAAILGSLFAAAQAPPRPIS